MFAVIIFFDTICCELFRTQKMFFLKRLIFFKRPKRIKVTNKTSQLYVDTSKIPPKKYLNEIYLKN
jgi:SAM-dependent MidA family methyltransferase